MSLKAGCLSRSAVTDESFPSLRAAMEDRRDRLRALVRFFEDSIRGSTLFKPRGHGKVINGYTSFFA